MKSIEKFSQQSLMNCYLTRQQDQPSDIVDVNTITGPRKKTKQDYEERMESIKAGREGREKYGSFKGKRVEGASTTNKEKARNKAFMMVIHKKNVLQKKRMSLREKQVLFLFYFICNVIRMCIFL